MADSIERTIYRLEIDDSEYIKGVDRLSSSTAKLTSEQTKANAKLAELQKLQQSYKKSLEETTAVLQANEKETVELTKQLNSLKDSGKGASAEAVRLKNALRDIAVNTKEFKIEAGLLNSNLANTTNQIKAQTREIVAAEKANSGFTKGLTKTYSGLRTIAQLIPGIGIGGLVALISGPVINAFQGWFESLSKTNDALKLLNKATEESFKGGESGFAKASQIVNELRLNVDLAKEGFIDKKKVVEEYNTTMGKTAGTVKTLDEVEQKLVEHGDAYIRMMLLKAAANFALGKAAEKAFEAEEKRIKDAEKFLTSGDRFTRFGAGNVSAPGFVPGLQEQATQTAIEFNKAQSEKRKAAAVKQSEDEANTFEGIARKFQEDAAKIAKDHRFNFFDDTKDVKTKTVAGRKEVVNIYEQELQKLRADIAKLDEKGFTDQATITKAVEEDFKKRTLAFDKAFKNKQLTASQLASLKEYLSNLQRLTLEANLKDFKEKRAAYLQQINDELTSLQLEESTKRIATIQDSFERERQTIISETEKTVLAITKRRDKLISDITKNAAKSGLTPADIAPQIKSITDLYSKLLDDLEIIKNQKLQQLSFDTFEKLSEDARRLLDAGNLGISQGSLINIKEQTELFLQGKISYEKYQKELTAIARFEATERFRLEKLFLEQEIKIRQIKLGTDKELTTEQIKKLEDEIRRLQQQLANAEKSNAIATGEENKPDDKGRVSELVKYAQAIGSVIDSVIAFWQKANEAERAALDESISLQEQRVSAAQRIAERGNASYLKAEEDRLKELQVLRENAARRDLAINAALQASQLLVGITGAIAKIATPGIGIAETIGAIAVIFSALATGYGLVKSLQGNQPRLKSGTKLLKRDGHPSGTDTIQAWLNEGEAVIPTEKNKAYHPTVSAIYDGTIPAEHLNQFVKTYHSVKRVPQPNYDRIRDAAELSIGQDGKMAVLLSEQNKKLDENNDLLRQTNRALKAMGVNVNMDRNGIAVSVMEVVEQINIDKRS